MLQATHFVAESREHICVHFTTKSVHFARFVGSKQTCFEASDVTPMFDFSARFATSFATCKQVYMFLLPVFFIAMKGLNPGVISKG